MHAVSTPAVRDGSPAHMRYAWFVVGLLWFVALLNYLDRLTITSMRAAIVAEVPMSDAQFGLLTSVFLWVYGLCSPLGGFLADRYRRKYVILVSLAVWSVVTWLTGHVHSYGELLAVRAVMGISEACYIAAALALIADYHRGPTRSLATGLHQSGLYAGAALGGAGGWIAADHGWRAAFTVFGAIGTAYAVLLVVLLRDCGEGDDRDAPVAAGEGVTPGAAVAGILHARAFWVLVTYMALAAMAYWLVNGWLPTFLQERFAGWKSERLGPVLAGLLPEGWRTRTVVTQANAGLFATVPVQCASFLGVLWGGRWADRWSRRQPGARVMVAAAGFVFAGPFLVLLAETTSFPLVLVALVVFGIGRGFSDANVMPILCQVVHPRFRATAYGLLNLVGVSVGGGMIYAGGYLRDAHVGLTVPFALAGGGLLAAGFLLLLIRRREPDGA